MEKIIIDTPSKLKFAYKKGEYYMKYWIYNIDGTYGIVKADTEKAAKEKVLKAYTEHGGYESEITDDIIKIKNIDNHLFADNADVIEVCCMG